jgi:hypothetical protein
MLDGGLPALSGSDRSPRSLLRQTPRTGPDVPTASAASRHRPTRVPRFLLRQEAHTRSNRPDACFGRQRAPAGSPPPDARFGRRRPPTASAVGGRSMGGHEAPASPVETPPTSVGDATTDPGKRPHRLRPGASSPPASAGGEGTLTESGGFGRRPRWLRSPRAVGKPDGLGRRGFTSALLPRKESGPRGDGASRHLEARDANELVRDVLRRPGQPGGMDQEDGR